MSSSPELLEMRFKRFLHYGSELPIYKAGDRFFNKCYAMDHVPSLIKMLNEENPEAVVDTILKVKKEDTSLWPDALTFALVVCAQNENLAVQKAAYKAVRPVCKTARDIVLFCKFYRDLKPKLGGGNGFKRAIGQWYLVWMPFDLADILLHQRSYYGWKHTDVLRVAHIKPVSIEQQVLFTYATKGIEEATKRYGESPNEQVIELLEYITTVESFKKIKDTKTAAKALSLELHNIERVPTHLLKSQEGNDLCEMQDGEADRNEMKYNNNVSSPHTYSLGDMRAAPVIRLV